MLTTHLHVTNVPQKDVLPATHYLQFSCDAADHLTVKFPNPPSTIVQVIAPPAATEAKYLHRQPSAYR